MKEYPYITNLNILYQHLEVIDLPKIIAECQETWFNQSLTVANDSVIRVGIIQGEYHWHKHDHDDEFFFVLSGQLYIDFENYTTYLKPLQGLTVTKGVMHRTGATERTVILMVETKSIIPTGND